MQLQPYIEAVGITGGRITDLNKPVSEFTLYLERLEREGYRFDVPEFKKHSGWNYLIHQIDLALYCIRKLRNKESSVGDVLDGFECTALLTTFLVNYGKCFNSGGKGRPRGDENLAFQGCPEAQAAHKRIMDLRNRFAGHNDEAGIVQVMIAVQERSDGLHLENILSIQLRDDDYERFELAAQLTKQHIISRLAARMRKLEGKIGKPIHLDL